MVSFKGCPVSVILINALLSVVMKAVKKEAEGVSPKSYADDATLLSRLSEAALQKGVDVVDEFCTLTGMELNLQKTVAFSTRRRHQSTLRLRSVDALLRFSKSVKCLGVLVSTAKNRTERPDSERVEKAAALAEGLRHAPFRYEKRVRIVQSNVLPAALLFRAGVEGGNETADDVGDGTDLGWVQPKAREGDGPKLSGEGPPERPQYMPRI
ncbi:hypothetical protein DIPPA_00632 [Diplonema papillatum]|nr:hypothetical protein DIPPA_00632 [Diplonema papillatum]